MLQSTYLNFVLRELNTVTLFQYFVYICVIIIASACVEVVNLDDGSTGEANQSMLGSKLGGQEADHLAGMPIAGEAMAGMPIAGEPIAGEPMAGMTMTGEPMAGMTMAGEPMAGMTMAGEPMAGMTMAGEPMAGIPMAGMPMAGMPMAGEPMAGEPMAGVPMAGMPMAGMPVVNPSECMGLLNCLQTCNASINCVTDCYTQASPEAAQLLSSVFTCAQANMCTIFQPCLETACRAELDACAADMPLPEPPPPPSLTTCLEVNSCLLACPNGDAMCEADCLNDATQDAAMLASDFYGCRQRFMCNTNVSCLTSNCEEELLACVSHQ